MGMDELVIGDKKYVSSKLAAKATGYAKDYVGQLCREGRVPARLVGRSWYVLESAIHDHRFGEPKETPVSEEGKKNDAPPITPVSAWEPPRYIATENETLPSVNRLKADRLLSADQEEEEVQQDTWQAWFDKFESVARTPVAYVVPVEEPEERVVQEEQAAEQDTDVTVPIRTIHNSHYRPLPAFEEPVPHRQEAQMGEELLRQKEKGGSWRAFKTIRLAGVLLALIMLVISVFGSGYLDTYIISNSTARIIAGMTLFQR